MSRPKFTIGCLRRISPEDLDLSATVRDELQSSTFCETEDLLRRSVDGTRALMHAGRGVGLNTRAVVESYTGSGELVLRGDAECARVLAHFAAGERGARIGAQAAKVFVNDARRFAANVVASSAPWLVDVVDDDDEQT